jgi:hypothetical protein
MKSAESVLAPKSPETAAKIKADAGKQQKHQKAVCVEAVQREQEGHHDTLFTL